MSTIANDISAEATEESEIKAADSVAFNIEDVQAVTMQVKVDEEPSSEEPSPIETTEEVVSSATLETTTTEDDSTPITSLETTTFAPPSTDEPAATSTLSAPEEFSRAYPKKQKKQISREGKPLSECVLGSEIMGVVKTVTGYGAFVDIGFQSDGLLHISRISNEFISNISDILQAGDEVSVRVIAIDAVKHQVSLTMRTPEDEQRAELEYQERMTKRRIERPGGK